MDFKSKMRGLIHLAQDRDQWRALANTVMNLRVLVAEQLAASEGLRCVELVALVCRAPSSMHVVGVVILSRTHFLSK
jgi:hypothetical protein